MSYLLGDQIGSVSTIASNTGSAVVNESFAAFGNRRNSGTWSGAPTTTDLTYSNYTRQAYTFQTSVGQNMGLSHMNGRVQDAVTGAFISPDPHIQDPTSTQAYNRYSYVMNNPLTFTDPTGFYCGDPAPIPIPTPISTATGDSNSTETLEEFVVEAPCVPREVYIPPAPELMPLPSADEIAATGGAPTMPPIRPANHEWIWKQIADNSAPCRDGSSPSAGNNPNVQSNIRTFGAVGASSGAVIGAVIVANLIGFPEVPAAEAGAAVLLFAAEGAHVVAFGGILGSGVGSVVGGGIGYNLTQPTCR
jgi:RHS repeat-associated protein